MEIKSKQAFISATVEVIELEKQCVIVTSAREPFDYTDDVILGNEQGE